MKYRIVKVEHQYSTVYEVQRGKLLYTMVVPLWEFEREFSSLSAAEYYVQSKSQPKRTVIKEYEV